jgi:multiple sugar transport system substrate-binding protein
VATDASESAPEPEQSARATTKSRWQALRHRLARRWTGWTGLVVGVVVGAVLATVTIYSGLPLLRRDGLERGELVLLSGADKSQGGQRRVLIKGWNDLHPEQPVRLVEVPSTADAERSQMLASARGDGGAVDVLNLDVAWLPEFAAGHLLREFGERGVDSDAFLDGPLRTCEYGGKLWGLPFNTDAGLLFRNTKWSPKPPASWQVLKANATSVLYGKGRPPGLDAALVTQLGDYEGLTVNALEAVWSAGGEIVDDDGDVRVDSRAAREGLQNLVDGVWQHEPQLILPESVSDGEDESTAAFRDGRTMYLRNWPVAYPGLTAAVDSGAGPARAAGEFAVSPLPWPSVLGGQNLVITERSKHPRAARALIEYLTDERSQQILFERGGFAATRRIVYTDPRIKTLYPWAPALRSAVENARLRPRTPHYALFSEVLREVVYQMLATGEGPPRDLPARLRAALRGQRSS